MSEWPVSESVEVYDCGWFSVGYDVIEQPSGEMADYYWIDRPTDGVGIVAIQDGNVAMVEQYRPKLDETFLECPGGSLEADESYQQAAARELREETGLRAGRLDYLTEYYPTATMRYKRGIVVATDLDSGEQDPDDGEYISWQFYPVDEVFEQAQTPPTTGWTLTSLLAARERGYV